MKLRHKAAVAAAALTLAALTSACSSSAASGGSSSQGVTSAKAEIPVGVIGSYSGPQSSTFASAKASIQAWADSVNAAGGIGGHAVHLYIEDDGGNPAVSLTEVKKLVEQDHVVAIVGQTTGDPAAFQRYIDSAGVPVIGGNPQASPYLTDPNWFAVGGNLVASFYGIAATARQNGPELGNLYCAELPACASTVTLLQAFGRPLGVAVTYSSKVSASAPDFTAVCQGLIRSGVQSYTLGLAAATLKEVASQCQQQGLKARLILSDVADSTFTSDSQFDGLEVVDDIFPFFDESTSATKAFHAALRQYEPSVGTAALPLDSQAAVVWASGKLFEAAVHASGAGPITPESVKNGLYALKGDTLGGLTVPLTFTRGKATNYNCNWVYMIKNGAFIAPNGTKATCGSLAAINPVIAALGQ
jgi:branched-chain amino acid transport system substrate-binding protein